MKWEGHVARMESRKNALKISVRKSEDRDHFEDTGTDGRIVSKGP
jgi:hypothetical protein